MEEGSYRIKYLDLRMMSNKTLHMSGRLSMLFSLVKDGFYKQEKNVLRLRGDMKFKYYSRMSLSRKVRNTLSGISDFRVHLDDLHLVFLQLSGETVWRMNVLILRGSKTGIPGKKLLNHFRDQLRELTSVNGHSTLFSVLGGTTR